MKINKVVCLCFVFAVLTGCNNRPVELPLQEYVRYINESSNGIINKKEFNGVLYELRYNTPELMVLKSHHYKNVDEKSLTAEKEIYTPLYSFDLIIKDSEAGGSQVKKFVYEKSAMSELVAYINMEFQKNIVLVTEQDTLLCSICHMEPPSRINPELRFALAFSRTGSKQVLASDCQFVLTDELFKNGPLKFSFKKEDISAIPRLSM